MAQKLTSLKIENFIEVTSSQERFFLRLIATSIDFIVLILAYAAFAHASHTDDWMNSTAPVGVFLLSSITELPAYCLLEIGLSYTLLNCLLERFFGGSIGKILTKLTVVKQDCSATNFAQSFLRNGLKTICMTIPPMQVLLLIDLGVAAFTKHNRSASDLLTRSFTADARCRF